MRDKRIAFRCGLRDRHEELLPEFIRLLKAAAKPTSWCLDVGTGDGRVAFFLAPLVRWVLGVDRIRERIERAREIAAAMEIKNVQFIVADAEALNYSDLSPLGKFNLTASNLCLSDEIIAQASKALSHDGWFVATCFENKHWRETGFSIDSSYSEAELKRVLKANSLEPDNLIVRTKVIEFKSLDQVKHHYLPIRLTDRWQDNERWKNLEKNFRSGVRTLTDSRIVFNAKFIEGEGPN